MSDDISRLIEELISAVFRSALKRRLVKIESLEAELARMKAIKLRYEAALENIARGQLQCPDGHLESVAKQALSEEAWWMI